MTRAHNGAVSTANSVSTLLEMLTAKRPAGSKSERRFIREHIEPLGVTRDGFGNLFKRIGDAPVLWSCHTDTVHRDGGSQMVLVEDGFAVLPKDSQSNCLGADDTAGVWIMCEMIRAQRPGLYVFHRSEEIGGVGSSHIAMNNPGLLSGIACAIALDRRGTGDVITHQGPRCCSDAFAKALAKGLGGSYAPSSQGIFTDTANYIDLVGECTNLSVGYMNEHRATENLDIPFIVSLRDTLLSLDTRDLPIERKPGDPDDYDSFYEGGSHWSKWQDYGSAFDQRRLIDLVRDYPDEVSDILGELGYDAETLMREIKDRIF